MAAGTGGPQDATLALAIAQERASRTSSIAKALQSYVYPTAAIILLVALWQVATVVLSIPIFLLPSPLEVGGTMVEQAALLLEHSQWTLIEIVLGFGLSIAVGVPLAVVISYSPIVARILYPLLVASQTIPKVAIAPLFLVWFGFGIEPKLIMVFLIAFFPIVISTVVGLSATEPELLHLVRSMGASAWQQFWKIRLPNALPSFFGGLKVSIALAVVGAVVAEFVGADQGLGYLILVANGMLDTKLALASVTMLSLMGVVLFLIVEQVGRYFVRNHGD
jgi:NitT/TauT family transport system permease protein